MTRIYPTEPDHGDRFQRMWEAYHAAPASRVCAPLLIALGALAGLVAAWWL